MPNYDETGCTKRYMFVMTTYAKLMGLIEMYSSSGLIEKWQPVPPGDTQSQGRTVDYTDLVAYVVDHMMD